MPGKLSFRTTTRTPVHIEDPDAPQGVRPLGVDPGFPHEVVVASAGVRSQFVGGGVRGRPELQVLPGVSAQGDVDGTRHVEVRMFHERGHELVDGRAGRDVVRSGVRPSPTELGQVQPAAATEEQTCSAGWRVASRRRERRTALEPCPAIRNGERDADRVVLRARFDAASLPHAQASGARKRLDRIRTRRQRAVGNPCWRGSSPTAMAMAMAIAAATVSGLADHQRSLAAGNKLIPTIATTTTAAAATASLKRRVHLSEPPRRPPGTALWGRGKLVEHVVQDAVRERGGALLQPRPNDAGDVAIGAHRATSRGVGRASASRAARRPRIA